MNIWYNFNSDIQKSNLSLK